MAVPFRISQGPTRLHAAAAAAAAITEIRMAFRAAAKAGPAMTERCRPNVSGRFNNLLPAQRPLSLATTQSKLFFRSLLRIASTFGTERLGNFPLARSLALSVAGRQAAVA